MTSSLATSRAASGKAGDIATPASPSRRTNPCTMSREAGIIAEPPLKSTAVDRTDEPVASGLRAGVIQSLTVRSGAE
ncbi:hypothetical protein GCM10010259_02860 [Streptomyces daghestanicus]|uniref:Uncharacterized protein n=1 Tax=Streptomyces daghestanicus TaxID=66885 RepID=A0ABQ3QDB5_9ACTN|nr:hypothetical protein GCM10010240_09670 [Streptomyces griseoviridis]GGU15944.1 hypothetical protein GCM10010259_02860 [Streptomyces daghestanicus]GHI35267.1 hypothetical protein Sdagh_69970 [Streptomyces daghestanicus]